MLIPEHKIEEVLSRVDLVHLVSRYVELKKVGRSHRGRCPFHQEKSPSFYVTPEMRRFKCFGCQAGGDAIAFIQRYLGKTFTDAVQDLAREAGVDLDAAVDPAALERQQLKEATDLAAQHFKDQLWSEAGGRDARAYLKSRGLSEEMIRAFGLGWAPAEWDLLAKRFLAEGILEFGAKAGLVAPRRQGEGYYDMFRGRLMVPIRNPDGRPIAFGGRLLADEEGPKYLNSRESRLYNKSETLYGLDQAREEIRRTKSAVLVEGYFDCIGLHQVGVRNTVALCSTALTSGHLALLARMEARELTLLLDGDEAGVKAVERLAGSLFATGTATRVALLPEGEDPDTYARKVGKEGVLSLLKAAQPLSRYLLETLLPGGKTASFEEKVQALSRLRPVASALPVGLFRSAFIASLAEHSGLPSQELEVTLKGKPAPVTVDVPKSLPGGPGTAAGGGKAPPPRPGPLPGVRAAPEQAPQLRESLYVAALLREPRLLGSDVFRVGDELRHTGLRGVVAALSAGTLPADLFEEMGELIRRAIQAVTSQLPSDSADLDHVFRDTCRRLKLERIQEQLAYITRVVSQVDGAHELTEETKRLQEQRVELLGLKRRVLEEATEAPTPGTKRTAHSV